ncbi:Battenin [Entamoeba marina]
MNIQTILTSLHLNKSWDYYRNYLGFFIVGTINNINYVVVNSAAKRLCSLFDADEYNPLILWCNVFAGLVLRILNMVVLYRIPVKIRLIFCTIFNLIGLFGVVLSVLLQNYFQSTNISLFLLCLAMILVIGGIQSLGESVILSYAGRFPAEMVNGWSSGTGFAGVAGSGLYLFFSGLNIPDTIAFTSLTPLCIIFALVIFFVIKPVTSSGLDASPLPSSSDEEVTSATSLINPAVVQDDEDDNQVNLPTKISLLEDEEAEEGSFFTKLKEGIIMTWWLGLNLTLVYFFEYVINPSAAYVAMDIDGAEKSDNFFIRNYYEVLAFCYQIGVFISRSSLSLIKIKPVWILTIMQGSLCVFMCFQGIYHFMVDVWGIWVMIGIFLIVGLVGGAGYVNVMYWVLEKKMKKETREMGMSFVTTMNTLALLVSSALSLGLNETIWKNNFKDD